MTILVVGNTKGGVGKTTTAIEIAIERARVGRRVLVVDGDRQATAQKAIAIRDEAGVLPAIACATYFDGPVLRSQVLTQKDLYDDIIIDAGGRDSTALRAAMSLADVLLVPFEPRSFEVWALEDIAALVDEVRSVRDGLRVYAFLNKAEPGVLSTDNRDAADAVADFPQIEYLPKILRRRKAYSNAAGAGLSVSEVKVKDPKAIAELKALIAAVF
ncbi:AAA family ATPase [Pseudomonas sp. NPDC099000]|uniref:AAA family ATPase n=1 Tax=Pseudomonas sp. NPDC099000 TaxID=3364488 RepID=UPI00383A0D5F